MQLSGNPVPALLSVQAVALSPRVGRLLPWGVIDMQRRCADLLPDDHPMRAPVEDFAARYPALRRDAYALRLLGEELAAALDQALNPARALRAQHWSDHDGQDDF